MEEHQLRVHPTASFYGYDPQLNPSVSNVFANAAYRMGHSQIPPELLRADRNYVPILPHIPYHEAYFNATYMYDVANGGMDSIVRGMTIDELPKVDGYITTAVTRHLFANPEDGWVKFSSYIIIHFIFQHRNYESIVPILLLCNITFTKTRISVNDKAIWYFIFSVNQLHTLTNVSTLQKLQH